MHIRRLTAIFVAWMILSMGVTVTAKDIMASPMEQKEEAYTEAPLLESSYEKTPEEESTAKQPDDNLKKLETLEEVIPHPEEETQSQEGIIPPPKEGAPLKEVIIPPPKEEAPLQEGTIPPQKELLDVNIEFIKTPYSWVLRVILPQGLRENSDSILPYYSLDGENFVYCDDWVEIDLVRDGTSIDSACEPVKSYLAGDIQEFWFRLEIAGLVYNGLSTTVHVTKDQNPQKPSQYVHVNARLPNTIETYTRPGKYKGLYQITVQEGCTKEELLALLPSTLPVKIDLMQGQLLLASQMMEYEADWKLPDEIPQSDFIHTDMALIPPTGAVNISSPDKTYEIEQLPIVKTLISATEFAPLPFELIVSVVPKERKAEPLLSLLYDASTRKKYLSFTLNPKPTGAIGIAVEYSLDDGKTWQIVERAEGNDVIALGNPVDAVPKYSSYTASLYLDADKAPMKEYLADNTKGFLLRLVISGGVYDGISETAVWPADYEYLPPPTVDGSEDGSGGNRGDAGTDNSGSGGIRPKPENPDTQEPTEKLPEYTENTHSASSEEEKEEEPKLMDKLSGLLMGKLEISTEILPKAYEKPLQVINKPTEETEKSKEALKNTFAELKKQGETGENFSIMGEKAINDFSENLKNAESLTIIPKILPVDDVAISLSASLPKQLSESHETDDAVEISEPIKSYSQVESIPVLEATAKGMAFENTGDVYKQKELHNSLPKALLIMMTAVGSIIVLLGGVGSSISISAKASAFLLKIRHFFIHP